MTIMNEVRKRRGAGDQAQRAAGHAENCIGMAAAAGSIDDFEGRLSRMFVEKG